MKTYNSFGNGLPANSAHSSPTVLVRAAGQDSPDLAFLDIWRILVKRRWLIACCAVGLGVVALGLSLLMTPRYAAYATVQVNAQNADLLGTDAQGVASASDSFESSVVMQTEVQVLQSDALTLQVVRELDLEKVPPFARKKSWKNWLRLPSFRVQKRRPANFNVALEQSPERRTAVLVQFRRNLKVSEVQGTRIIQIQFLNPDPAVAAKVVNTLVRDYIDQHYRNRYTATSQASLWLAKELTQLKTQVQEAQERAVRYQRDNGILGGDDDAHNITLVKLADLNSRLTAVESNRFIKEAIYQLSLNGNPEVIGMLEGVETAPGAASVRPSASIVPALRQQETELRSSFAQLSAKYGAAYPRVREVQKQLDEIQKTITAENERMIGRIKAEYDAAARSEHMLRQQFEKQKQEANLLNDRTIQFTILKHEADASRDLYESMTKKLNEAGLLAGIRSSNITLVDSASESPDPVKPNIPMNAAVGIIGGLFGGLILAFVRENMDQTVRTPEQIAEITKLPSLAIVPRTAKHWSRNLQFTPLPEQHDTQHLRFPVAGSSIACGAATEAYRTLRTSLMLGAGERPPRVIVVTSPLPSEGKSATALNLAVSMADQGTRTLLIEADMRRPVLRSTLGIETKVGLSSVLTGQSKLGDSTRTHPATRALQVLCAGPRPENPAELLSAKKYRELLEEAAKNFDHIVVDTPAALSVSDSAVIASAADAVLLVVRYGVTARNALLRAQDTLHRVNAPLAGIVLNCINLKSTDYRYSGYGRSYEYYEHTVN